ncbi:retention module-containing protein, partial [Uliginosibacterium paludis]
MAIPNSAAVLPHVASILRIDGKAYLRDATGLLQPLKAGDEIREGQQFVVAADGGMELRLADGETIAVGGGREILADREFLRQEPVEGIDAAVKALAGTEAERVIASLNAGRDPLADLDPTAAGLSGSDGSNAGHSFVRVLRIAEELSGQSFEFSSAAAAQELALPETSQPDIQAEAPAAADPATPPVAATLSLSSSATTVTEGGSVVYTATVSSPVTGTPLILTLSNGQTITIPVGSTSGSSAPYAVRGDDVYAQGDQTLSISVSSSSGGGFSTLDTSASSATANTTVQDDTDLTTVSLSASSTAAEGGTITYTASLDHAAATPVTVALSNGSSITIAAGATTGSVSVPAPSDDVYVDAGNTSVTITGTSGGGFERLVASSTPAVTAVSDTIDTTSATLTASSSVAEGSTITYTVTLASVVTGS